MPYYEQLRGHADLFAHEHLVQIVNASDRLLIKTDDQIAVANTCAFGWAVLFGGDNEHACFQRKIVIADNAAVQRHVLTRDADVAAPNFSIANKPRGHELRGIARDRETNALGWPDHGRVNA